MITTGSTESLDRAPFPGQRQGMVIGFIALASLLIAATLFTLFLARQERCRYKLELEAKDGTILELTQRVSEPPSWEKWVARDRHENTVGILVKERDTWRDKAMADADQMGAAQERLGNQVGQLQRLIQTKGILVEQMDVEAEQKQLDAMRDDLKKLPVTTITKGDDGVYVLREEPKA